MCQYISCAAPAINLLLFSTFTLAGVSTPLHAVEQGYALGKVAVTEGLSVAGFENGVVFSQTFDNECHTIPTGVDSEDLPLVSDLFSTPSIGLDVSVMGCRVAAAPAVECSWRIRPQAFQDETCAAIKACQPATDGGDAPATCSGSASWTGWSGQVPVTVPKETGVYEFVLDCSIEGIEAPAIKTPLYVTYAKPLEVFSPPEPAWYERASCWGAGFTTDAVEAEVLEGLLEGLYRYGELNWRYGYATKKSPLNYQFFLFEEADGTGRINLEFADQSVIGCDNSKTYCECTWQALVADDSVCDFAACYTWSRVLQAIAGVAGIGGLEPVSITGKAGVGFVVKPDTKSFDGDFPGNVSCPRSEGECFPYNFSSHSLRARSDALISSSHSGQGSTSTSIEPERVYYDATFNNTYAEAYEPIGLNAKNNDGQEITFLESDGLLRKIDQGYGNWNFWNLGLSEAELSIQRGQPGGIEFTGKVTYSTEPLFAGSDTPYEALVAEVGVEILVPGEHLVTGVLFSDPATTGGTSVVIASRSSATSAGPSVAVASGQPGDIVNVKLDFSGNEIRHAKINGHYIGHFHSADQSVKVGTTETYTATDFSEHSVVFVRAEGKANVEPAIDFQFSDSADPDSSDEIQRMVITAELEVYQAGSVGLETRLTAGNGSTVTYSGATKDFSAPADPCDQGGTGCLELTLETMGSNTRGRGPFEFTFVLYGEGMVALDSFSKTFEDLSPASSQ